MSDCEHEPVMSKVRKGLIPMVIIFGYTLAEDGVEEPEIAVCKKCGLVYRYK